MIVDAMDNFKTRFILNEVAVNKKIPLFHGAVAGFEGRVTTIIPGRTVCLKVPLSPEPRIRDDTRDRCRSRSDRGHPGYGGD